VSGAVAGSEAPVGGATVYPFVVDLVGHGIGADDTVLELGCGAMQYAALLPGRYLGLDVEQSPYVRARPHLVASAERIPVDDATVDVVFGVAAFYLMEPVDAVFAECARVLRRGGRLVVVDYQRPVLERFATGGGTVHVWTPSQLRERIAAAGFPRRRIHDLSHRVRGTQTASAATWPARYLKERVGRHGQWLVLEAVR
jgi:ubiquinone/menaquinone biosynthesis C-methylase UbiE